MALRTAAGKAKLISAEEAAGFVKSGMWLEFGTSLCQPDVFDKALANRASELSNVKIRACLSMRPRAVLEHDPEGHHFYWFNHHFSGYDRRQHDQGRSSYQPVNLGEIPDYYRRFFAPMDIVIYKCCPMDKDGWFNFSAANLWHRSALDRAKLVIIEVTEGNPYCCGVENGVHISEVDYIIQGDNQPAPELPNPAPTEADVAVAKLIAGEIGDNSCLQIGIGGMPNAVCAQLLHAAPKGLGIYSEMLTDGIMALYEKGLVKGEHKQVDPGRVTYSFALGSKATYDRLDHNADFNCCAVDFTNLPHNIMKNSRVVSINNTTQIDLQGQCASESDGHRHISGTGGQLQFVRGAYASPGGKSFICLSSTYTKRGEPKSRIVLNLTPGNIVTTPRSDVMYVVTEYGMVNLKGKTVPERALGLISIAHPDFREELERQAYEHKLIPRGVTF